MRNSALFDRNARPSAGLTSSSVSKKYLFFRIWDNAFASRLVLFSLSKGTRHLCSARYFWFLNQAGASIGVETDGIQFYELDGYGAHTNNFISQHGMMLEGRPKVVEESEGRRALMTTLFSHEHKTIEDVFASLSASCSGHLSVVKAGVGREDRTCAAFAISPNDGKMWYTRGPPKDNQVNSIAFY